MYVCLSVAFLRPRQLMPARRDVCGRGGLARVDHRCAFSGSFGCFSLACLGLVVCILCRPRWCCLCCISVSRLPRGFGFLGRGFGFIGRVLRNFSFFLRSFVFFFFRSFFCITFFLLCNLLFLRGFFLLAGRALAPEAADSMSSERSESMGSVAASAVAGRGLG